MRFGLKHLKIVSVFIIGILFLSLVSLTGWAAPETSNLMPESNSIITATPVENTITPTETTTAEEHPELTVPQQETLELNQSFFDKVISELKGFETNVMEIVYVVLATWLLFFAIRKIRLAFTWLDQRLLKWKTDTNPSIKLKELELVNSEQLSTLITAFHKLLLLGVILWSIYVYLTFVFGLFPATRGIALALQSYLLGIVGFFSKNLMSFIPNLLSIFTIIAGAYFINKFLKFLMLSIARENVTFKSFHREWAIPTYRILSFLVFIFSLIMIFPYLPGYNSPAFNGITVFMGLLISLGSSSAIANIIAGIVLVYMRPFKVGDRVQVANITGDIIEMNFLVTRIRTPKNEDTTLPNAMILSSAMTNYSALASGRGLILHTTVTIGYDIPWPKVHELLINAATNIEGIMAEPKPFVLQTSLDDFYVSYELNAYTDKAAQMPKLYSHLHQNIQEQFNQAGIEILSPHYKALRDGGSSTVVTPQSNPQYQEKPITLKMEQ